MAGRYWLLLEKSDETRISKGIDGYQDKTGEAYQYDSLVPNHKQIASGDCVVLRKENNILGVGRISKITRGSDAKLHRRCPDCSSTDIRERRTKLPKWKCGRCANEFTEPHESIAEVQTYEASIEGFAKLTSPPTVSAVKNCAYTGDGASSQLSILELDPKLITTLLEGTTLSPSRRNVKSANDGQGFGLSPEERKQVELRAMHIARRIYENQGWQVVDKSGSESYDLLATRKTETRFIEVKGTTGRGESIVLTHGEVAHVSRHRNHCALIVISGISLARDNGVWIASGGTITTHEDPWTIDAADLQATVYRYSVVCKRSTL